MYHLLIVFANATAGWDEAFNSWYTNVHVRDVMGLRGAIAVQRFSISKDQLPGQQLGYGYLALYEGSNVQKLIDGHKPAFTDKMPISKGLDLTAAYDTFFDTLAYGTNQPGMAPDGDVIVDMVSGELDTAALAHYRDECLALLALPGFISAQVVSRSREQMLGFSADTYGHGCVWRLSDRATALRSLEQYRRDHPSRNVTICFEPVMRRLEAGDVVHATPEERAVADQVRQGLREADLYPGPPE